LQRLTAASWLLFPALLLVLQLLQPQASEGSWLSPKQGGSLSGSVEDAPAVAPVGSGSADNAAVSSKVLFVPAVNDPFGLGASAQPVTVFNGQIASGWLDWSWDALVGLIGPSSNSSGKPSIQFRTTAGYGGLRLEATSPIPVTSNLVVQFMVKAAEGDGRWALTVFDGNHNRAGQPEALAGDGGDPVTSAWKTYTIPLTRFLNVTSLVGGIAIQDYTGQAGRTLFVDAVQIFQMDGPLPTPTATPDPNRMYYGTLPPGAALPSGQQCSSVLTRSSWEPRPQNSTANQTRGAPGVLISGSNAAGNLLYAPRIDGNFTGTTDEIFRWAACKWGIDEDTIRAVAMQESQWIQSTLGEFDGTAFQAFGLTQILRTAHPGTWPMSQQSTPFNVDYYAAWRRACYDGYFSDWVPSSSRGDDWGCIGLWYSGKWNSSGALNYITNVQRQLANKPWLQPDF
jgi:autotransporter family porin